MSSEALSNVICDIYDAAIDPTHWHKALETTCAFVGGSSAVLYWHDAAMERSEALHLFNDDPHYTKLYFEKYVAMNPVFPAATFIEAGEVHTNNDILPHEELIATRFYKEWVEPQGIVDAISVNLEKGIMRASLLNIRRHTREGFADEGAISRTRLLVPHYQRAVTIGRLFDRSKSAEAALGETLDGMDTAVFLVTAEGEIVFSNSPAKSIIEEGLLLRSQDDRLVAALPEANRSLKDLFAAAKSGTSSAAVSLSSAAQDRWFANVLPLTTGARRQSAKGYSAVAAVFIRKTSFENPTSLEALAKQYKLTASEIRIVDAVVKVGSVKVMAEMLGITQATVKTHLQNIFRKTGTNRQSDLVRLIAGFSDKPVG